MENNCTILVNSSDAYSDTWHPFFLLFKKYWSDCPFEIVLNTECMKYEDRELKVRNLNLYEQGEKSNYGERMLKALRAIGTKYVLIFLDDFFLRRTVKTENIIFLINEMEKNNKIVTFTFEANENSTNVDDKKYKDYLLKDQCSEWKFNLQCALWRRDELMSLIRPHETPWSLERMGTIRAFRNANYFYVLKKQEQSPIDYGKTPGLTWGIIRGKWVKENVMNFFEKNGIEVDYEKRGFFESGILEQNKGREPIDLINTIKSLGIQDALNMFLWRGVRFVKSRLGLRYFASYTDYRRAKLKKNSHFL